MDAQSQDEISGPAMAGTGETVSLAQRCQVDHWTPGHEERLAPSCRAVRGCVRLAAVITVCTIPAALTGEGGNQGRPPVRF
jgi:hypothetical protein